MERRKGGREGGRGNGCDPGKMALWGSKRRGSKGSTTFTITTSAIALYPDHGRYCVTKYSMHCLLLSLHEL